MHDLLSDFTRNSADWLRRTSAGFSSLPAEEWSSLAYICEDLSRINVRSRDNIRSDLKRGIEAGKLQVRLEKNITAVNDNIQIMESAEKDAENAHIEIQEAVNRIRSAKAEAKAVQAELVSLLALTKAKPSPVPEDILAEAEAGSFVRLDEFKKRR